MAMVKISFDVAGERQVSRAFELTAAEAQDMSEPLARVGELLLEHIGIQFATEGGEGMTGHWMPLTPVYRAWKEAHFPGAPILVRTGAMRAAALDPTDVDVSPRRMVYEIPGQPGEIAFFHQIGAGHLPARPIVSLTMADKREMVDRTFSEWINAIRHRPIGAAA